MRVLLTIVLTCLFSPSLYAQPSEKQLIHAYQTAESDEEKIKSLELENKQLKNQLPNPHVK